tara:strand:+ start:536 stop:760 length:225 start_codon:yes stop_codon:yes gene_type:complete
VKAPFKYKNNINLKTDPMNYIKHLKTKSKSNGILMPMAKINIREKFIEAITMNYTFKTTEYTKAIALLNNRLNK